MAMRITKFWMCVTFGLFTPLSHGQQCGTWMTVQGKAGLLKARKFEDGSIALKTPLAVNPDGADLSYAKSDSGFTYINNGVAFRENGVWLRCDKVENSKECTKAIKDAESKDFIQGTAEFCVFGMTLEKISGNLPLENCGGEGRLIAGNGKGGPAALAPVKNTTGQMIIPYQSQTALKNQVTVGGVNGFGRACGVAQVVAHLSAQGALD
jgi:hypothetical protein